MSEPYFLLKSALVADWLAGHSYRKLRLQTLELRLTSFAFAVVGHSYCNHRVASSQRNLELIISSESLVSHSPPRSRSPCLPRARSLSPSHPSVSRDFSRRRRGRRSLLSATERANSRGSDRGGERGRHRAAFFSPRKVNRQASQIAMTAPSSGGLFNR